MDGSKGPVLVGDPRSHVDEGHGKGIRTETPAPSVPVGKDKGQMAVSSTHYTKGLRRLLSGDTHQVWGRSSEYERGRQERFSVRCAPRPCPRTDRGVCADYRVSWYSLPRRRAVSDLLR